MSMIRKNQWIIFIINLIMILFFAWFYLNKGNLEFIIYVSIIIVLFGIIILTNEKVRYPNYVLWLLTGWALIHMAGGSVRVGDGRLYDVILINISETYRVLKYDQFGHIFGFMTATFLAYELVKKFLKRSMSFSIGLIILMAGLGLGALNEIIEFIVILIIPETGIGGYENSMLDLVSDLIGAIIAIGILILKEN